jgi:hypothetical protein
MTDGYPWCACKYECEHDRATGWQLDEEYRGYLTEGWGTLRFRASVIKEMMDEMDGIDGW